jgi:phospholipid/cholesterol/gamma-HCH transport system permease protein
MFLRNLLTGLQSVLAGIGSYIILIWEVIAVIFTKPPKWWLIRDQLFSIGLLSMPVVAITGLSTGMVLAAQSFYQLADKGLAGATGIMVGKAMMAELGPVLTAFMVTGRIGSAMCAELGTMRVTEQLDAMRSMSVNPQQYLIAPRFIGGTFMLPLLTLFSILTGILGGYLMATYFFGMAPVTYFGGMQIYVTYFDLFTGMIKSVVFGFFISTISCYKGIHAFGGAAGVGRATTSSVVICYTCILISNFLMTLALNIIRLWFNRW